MAWTYGTCPGYIDSAPVALDGYDGLALAFLKRDNKRSMLYNKFWQVVELMAQVQEKTQRRQFLADHLAASRKVLAAHSINTTEFDCRKAEHQELASSIESLRQVYDLIVGLHGARLQTTV